MPTGITSPFCRTLIQRTIAQITLPKVDKPEAYLAVRRTLIAGYIRPADICRGLVYDNLATENRIAVWTMNRLVELDKVPACNAEGIVGHIGISKKSVNAEEYSSSILYILHGAYFIR
jgi:hypothetical protein